MSHSGHRTSRRSLHEDVRRTRGESHGHSPLEAPRLDRRVGARSNHARRHRLCRRRRRSRRDRRGERCGEQARHAHGRNEPERADAELLLRRRAAQGTARGGRHRLHRRAVSGEPARTRRRPLPARAGRRHRHRPSGCVRAQLHLRADRRRRCRIRVQRRGPRVPVDRRELGRPVHGLPRVHRRQHRRRLVLRQPHLHDQGRRGAQPRRPGGRAHSVPELAAASSRTPRRSASRTRSRSRSRSSTPPCSRASRSVRRTPSSRRARRATTRSSTLRSSTTTRSASTGSSSATRRTRR